MDKKSFRAVTIGPDATAGSIPIRAKNKGENTPKAVLPIQAPINPIPTIIPTATGVNPDPETPTKSSAYTETPHSNPKVVPAVIPISNSFKIASVRLVTEINPIAILLTRIVLH